jgi:hypothetical protein
MGHTWLGGLKPGSPSLATLGVHLELHRCVRRHRLGYGKKTPCLPGGHQAQATEEGAPASVVMSRAHLSAHPFPSSHAPRPTPHASRPTPRPTPRALPLAAASSWAPGRRSRCRRGQRRHWLTARWAWITGLLVRMDHCTGPDPPADPGGPTHVHHDPARPPGCQLHGPGRGARVPWSPACNCSHRRRGGVYSAGRGLPGGGRSRERGVGAERRLGRPPGLRAWPQRMGPCVRRLPHRLFCRAAELPRRGLHHRRCPAWSWDAHAARLNRRLAGARVMRGGRGRSNVGCRGHSPRCGWWARSIVQGWQDAVVLGPIHRSVTIPLPQRRRAVRSVAILWTCLGVLKRRG